MPPSNKQPLKVKISYTRSKDYRVVFADGAVVNYPASKAISINFFVGLIPPADELQSLNERGEIIESKLDVKEPLPYHRELQVQVIIPFDNAAELVKVINEKLQAPVNK